MSLGVFPLEVWLIILQYVFEKYVDAIVQDPRGVFNGWVTTWYYLLIVFDKLGINLRHKFLFKNVKNSDNFKRLEFSKNLMQQRIMNVKKR